MLPTKIDFTQWSREIEDQGALGACVANSDVSAIELITYRAHQNYNLSRLGLYHDTLVFENRLGQDGLIPRDGLLVGSTIGIGDESHWKYDVNQVMMAPPQAYYADAITQKITSYHSVALNPDSFAITTQNIKNELSHGNPVIVSFKAYDWERYISGDFSTQSILHGTTAYIGNHQWVIEGYDDTLNGGSFKVENSWTDAWGNHGIGAISYTLVQDIFAAYVIDGFANMDFRYTQQREQVTQLYVSLFNRAPELSGLNYWANTLDTQPHAQVAQAMYDCAPARQIYPASLSNSEIVTTFYVNVLGRQADAGGLAYWTSHLDAGQTKGQVITDIVIAVDVYTGTDPTALSSQHLFDNKVAVGEYYAINLQAENLSVAQVALIGVTSDANAAEAVKMGLGAQLGWI